MIQDSDKKMMLFYVEVPLSLLALVLVFVSIGEEFLFRAFLQTALMQWLGSILWAILGAALIFMLFHFQYRNPVAYLSVFIGGILLGWLFWFTKDIWAVVFSHFLYNLIETIVWRRLLKHNPSWLSP